MERQEPYGALLLDRCWNVLRANRGATRLLGAFLDPAVEPRVASNAVRAVLHPRGLRPQIVNWTELAHVILERVERECVACPLDTERQALRDEVRTYPGIAELGHASPAPGEPLAVVHLRREGAEVRLFTMLTTIGTPLDVTAQELAIECYFPADEASERWLRGDG